MAYYANEKYFLFFYFDEITVCMLRWYTSTFICFSQLFCSYVGVISDVNSEWYSCMLIPCRHVLMYACKVLVFVNKCYLKFWSYPFVYMFKYVFFYLKGSMADRRQNETCYHLSIQQNPTVYSALTPLQITYNQSCQVAQQLLND